MRIKKLLVFILLAILLLVGGAYLLIESKTTIQEDKKYSPVELAESGLVLTVIYPDTYDNKGGKIKAVFEYQTREPLPIDLNLIYFYLVKNDASVERIESVLTQAGTEPFEVSSDISGGYETRYLHSFVAETDVLPPARYIVRASVDNGRYSNEKEVYVHDRSYMQDINITKDRVTFDKSSNLFKSFESEVLESVVSEETSFSMNQPGRIKFTFVPKMPPVYAPEWDEVSLTIYPISEVVDWGPDKFANQHNLPYFVSNVRKLRELIRYGHLTENLYPVNNFPPVNASAVGTQRVTKLNFVNGEGIRFLVSGYHQAVDPADHPKYVYQGITEDGHYFVVFRYGSLFSPQLEKYLKKIVRGVDVDTYNTQVETSFDLLEREANFSPSLNELDQFIKSIRVRSEWENVTPSE